MTPPPVIAQMLTEEGIIMKDTLQKFIASVDVDPTTEDLETLFNKVRLLLLLLVRYLC